MKYLLVQLHVSQPPCKRRERSAYRWSDSSIVGQLDSPKLLLNTEKTLNINIGFCCGNNQHSIFSKVSPLRIRENNRNFMHIIFRLSDYRVIAIKSCRASGPINCLKNLFTEGQGKLMLMDLTCISA